MEAQACTAQTMQADGSDSERGGTMGFLQQKSQQANGAQAEEGNAQYSSSAQAGKADADAGGDGTRLRGAC